MKEWLFFGIKSLGNLLVNESLGELADDYNDHDDYDEVRICRVWVMDFVTKSFTKMFNIEKPKGKWPYHGLCGVLGFRKNGEVIIEVMEDGINKSRLDVYKPSSGRINGIGINRKSYRHSDSLSAKLREQLQMYSSQKHRQGSRRLLKTYSSAGIDISWRETQYLLKARQKDSESDVEEDQRTSNEFMADLNAEYQERALLANQKRFYKRSGGVGSARKPLEKIKETCFAYGKLDYKGKYKGLKAKIVVLTKRINDMTKGKCKKGKKEKEYSEKGLLAESFYWDDESISTYDEGSTKIRVHRLLSMTDSDERKHVLDYTHVDLHYVDDQRKILEPLSHLLKLIGLESLISLLTLNMVDLTLDTPDPKKTRASVKVSPAYVIKKKTEKSPVGPKPCSDKKADSSTNKLLLTQMEKPKCSTCGSTDHLTKEHLKHAAVKKTLSKLKAQLPLRPLQKKAPMIPKPFIECKYYGFNDHHSEHCEFYLKCGVCGSIAPEASDCPKKHPNSRRPRIANRQSEPTKKWDSGPKVVFGDDSLGETERKMENHNEVRVKELRSDNGIEFRNHKLKEFYNEKGDAINFNGNRSFRDDEFLEPRSEVTQCPGNIEYFTYIPAYENTTPSESPILQESSIALYLSKMAPTHIRGGPTMKFQLATKLGIFSAHMINYVTNKLNRWGWGLSLGLNAFMTVGGIHLPETEQYLASLDEKKKEGKL
nr:sugar carrier protein A [Tanacetum cinerariifolium]